MSTVEDLHKLRTLRSLLVEKAIRDGVMQPPRQWVPLPHQVPPEGDDWRGWLLMGGRGAGKTDAGARWVVDHVNGPPCLPGPTPHRIGILAPTQGDAATSCFEAPSGIYAHDPSAKLVTRQGGTVIMFANGSIAKLFGGSTPEEVERLRAGGNRCAFWIEELAAIRLLDQCFNHMLFGLRRTGTGPPPKWVASTTPKVRQLLKKMVNGDLPGKVVVTHATTYDNPHLQEQFRADLEAAYGGTTLGAQELLGQIIEEDENALWKREMILRAHTAPDDLVRVSVGVDPSGGAGEQGIVVVGKQERTEDGRKQVHGYVLGDYSCRLPPDGWGRRVVQAYLDFEADDIVVETNYGGDMAVSVIRGAADTMGVSVTIRTVTASRGKRVRAEPVAAMAAQGRWHHVGVFEELEAQMTQWTPESGYSPDRLDAMVWPAWHMKLVGVGSTNTVGTFGGGSVSRTRF